MCRHQVLLTVVTMLMRPITRAAMATTAFLSGRVGAFVSSGGLFRHAAIARTATARSLAMAAGEEKVGFIGERPAIRVGRCA